jgi:hypothetical protein
MKLRWLVVPCLLACSAPAWAIKADAVIGNWEAARSPDDERLYIKFMPQGKAQVVAEYDFQLPGQPGKRRGRSTTFAKWSVKGNEVTVSYASVHDRLRYTEKAALEEIGLPGAAPALKLVGKPAEKSRVRATLWKAPHDYKLKAADAASAAPAPVPSQGKKDN